MACPVKASAPPIRGDRNHAHIRPDLARAIEWYDRGCKLDHTPCCTRLGELLVGGVGVKPDPVRANAALQKACDADDTVACELLARHYHRGVGAKRDEQRAEKSLPSRERHRVSDRSQMSLELSRDLRVQRESVKYEPSMSDTLYTLWPTHRGIPAPAPVCFAVCYRNQAVEGRT